MLKIGTFSKLSRLSIRMLRRYDELGLLQPVHTDPFTGYRYYREEQLTTAGRIAALRDMGFGLFAIGALLEDGGREELDRRLAEQQRVLEALLAETRQRLRLLETARAQLRKDESTMEYSVTLKNLPQRRAACVRMTLPSYEAEHQLWQVMARETAPLSLRLEEPCLCSVTYYDGEYREREVDAEAQKTVRGDYPDTEHVRFRTLPAVTFASATFRGPYDKIRAANAAVAAWVRDNGYAFDGPAFNIYHVNPSETDDPEEYVTEVCYPVKKRA